MVATAPARTVSKAQRREQLIRATMKCVSRNGLSATTMAEITKEAGLSLGIVNLHFQSKEKLLVETLRYIADEYQCEWQKAVRIEGTPEEQLANLINLEFSAKVCQREKLAVWVAFWGEAKSRPTYRRICAALDKEYVLAIRTLCDEICKIGKYRGVDTEIVATGYSALTDGLWLDLLLTPRDMSRANAKRIAYDYFSSHFPGRLAAQS
ncbi:MAG: transcriptional regulator BetI [Gammaproteobacteria bacterium]|nr:transcriptional regulator BetI [Gammaproteobacteria bacterium]